MSSRYHAGLDDSGSGMAFAVMDECGQIVLDEFIPMNNRVSANLPIRMAELLQQHQIGIGQIADWSVGAGPGSFTGLRLASSFVMGLTFEKENVSTRCVSTASMIAACAGVSVPKILAVFDGRKKELLAFGLEKIPTGYRENGFQTVIRSGEDMKKTLADFDVAVAFAADHDACKAVTGPETAEKILRVERLSAVPLIRFEPENFDRPLSDLFYLRPAVFVEPRKLREIPEK